MLIGVDDYGRITGIRIGSRTIEDMVSKIAQSTNPKVYPEVRAVEVNGKYLLEVRVSERSDKSVFVGGSCL